jgi:hypothetical protein
MEKYQTQDSLSQKIRERLVIKRLKVWTLSQTKPTYLELGVTRSWLDNSAYTFKTLLGTGWPQKNETHQILFSLYLKSRVKLINRLADKFSDADTDISALDNKI